MTFLGRKKMNQASSSSASIIAVSPPVSPGEPGDPALDSYSSPSAMAEPVGTPSNIDPSSPPVAEPLSIGGHSGSDDGGAHNHFESSEYARRVQSLLNLLNDLHDLRATQFELSIPSVAVIGNQSSGKSSLIESICGISVPRDSGTCTRCPMRCEIRSADSSSPIPWSAKISIEVANPSGRTDFRHFGPNRIHDSKSVELWILRAQAAILNPHRADPSIFEELTREQIRALRNNDVDGSMLYFSEKLLKIVIECRDATPLTFIDLPGIVHNTPEGAPADTPLVIKRLVNDHIRKSDTIILVTIPAIDDLETQEAFKLARRVDPQNVRTLGVFTKTDLLTDRSTNLIERRRRELDNPEGGLGYFAVRLPDDSERDLSSLAVELLERTLFESQPPWKDVIDRKRLGVRNLVAHVGGLLADLVDARLPSLKREVDRAVSRTEAQLSKLPPEPDWAMIRPDVKLHLMLANFDNAVHKAVYASDSDTNEHMGLVQHNIMAYQQFAQQIKGTRPEYADQPQNYWDHIDSVVKKCTTWELPGNTPYLALKTLISEFTSQWRVPSHICFESISEELSSYIQRLITEQFKEYPNLRDAIMEVTLKFIRRIMTEADKRLETVWALEKRVPFYTLIQDEYTAGVQSWSSKLGYYGNSDRERLRELMAKALAYYDISSKRFIDYVLLTIELELNQSFSDSLHTLLLNDIAASSARSVAELMAEDPEILKKRMTLKEKLHALREIHRRLLEHDPELARVVGDMSDKDKLEELGSSEMSVPVESLDSPMARRRLKARLKRSKQAVFHSPVDEPGVMYPETEERPWA